MSVDLLRTNPTADMDHSLIAHLPMVRQIAKGIHRRAPERMDIDDLFSAGLLGLVEAFHTFESSKSVRFESFANFRVRGAMLDYLRTLDWAPRSLRRSGRAIDEAAQSLSSRLGHAPTEDQIAAELGMSLEAYQRLTGELDRAVTGSLYSIREDSSDEEIVAAFTRPEDDPLARFVRKEREERVSKAIEDLPDHYREVVTLHYVEEKTSREIGLAMGRKKEAIQQILFKAVRLLRTALADAIPEVASEPITV